MPEALGSRYGSAVTAQIDRRVMMTASVLVLASGFCCALVLARAFYVGHLAYGFLGWNLFLAWVPFGLSIVLAHRVPNPGRARPTTWLLGALWLAFFPNAPYVVTDLIHFRPGPPVAIFDAVLLFTFALTGMCLAFSSLLLVHRVVARRHGPWLGWLFVAVVALLSGFGIYLGRFQRWNSWDLLVRPVQLLSEMAGWVLHPFPHRAAFAFTALMGGVIFVAYVMLFALLFLGRAERTT
jgi:uncharacterized membrane protein